MMRIHAQLPRDRYVAGNLWVTDDAGNTILGPVRARGEADNKNAAASDNVIEDPTKVGGDHPYGTYKVTRVVRFDPSDTVHYRKYGPAFLALDPIAGEALVAKQNGRGGLGVHGGALHADGRLRETFGCNRADDVVTIELATMAEPELAAGREVIYVCEPEPA